MGVQAMPIKDEEVLILKRQGERGEAEQAVVPRLIIVSSLAIVVFSQNGGVVTEVF